MTDDPMALLEQEAKRQRLTEEGVKAVSYARSRLVLAAGRDPAAAFFAAPALKLKTQPDWSIPTAGVDGETMFYNPEFFAGLKPEERLGIVVHETMHCMLGHHARREGREVSLANIAMDLAINPLVQEANFALPPGRLMPGEGQYQDLPVGLSFEDYYYRLLKDKPNKTEGGGKGGRDGEGDGPPNPDPGGCGGVKDPGDGSQSACTQSEAEWKVAAAQAQQLAQQVAKSNPSKGSLPGWLERMVADLLAPKVDWKEVLRSFVSSHARNDYAFFPPNKRFIHQGIYLPGLRSEELGNVVAAIDTSGSIGDDMLQRFASELQGVLEAYDTKLTIVYCDAAINGVEEWTPNDGPLRLKGMGGGGTSHRPVFDWLDAQDEKPVCLIALTDLYTDFPNQAPEVPVLWAVVGGNKSQPPFGLKVEVK